METNQQPPISAGQGDSKQSAAANPQNNLGFTLRPDWRTIAFLGFIVVAIATSFMLLSSEYHGFSLLNFTSSEGHINLTYVIFLALILGAGCYKSNKIINWIIIGISVLFTFLPLISPPAKVDEIGPGFGILLMLAAISIYGYHLLHYSNKDFFKGNLLVKKNCQFIILIAIAQICMMWLPATKGPHDFFNGWNNIYLIINHYKEDTGKFISVYVLEYLPILAALLVVYGNNIIRMAGAILPTIGAIYSISLFSNIYVSATFGLYLYLIINFIAFLVIIKGTTARAEVSGDGAPSDNTSGNQPATIKPLTAKQKRMIRFGIIAALCAGLCIAGVKIYKNANTPEKLFEKGYLAYKDSDVEKAVSYFKRINDTEFHGYEFAQDISALYYLVDKQDYKKALKYVKRILDIDRYNEPATYSLLGRVYTRGELAPEIPADEIQGAKYYRFSPYDFEKAEAAKVLYYAGLYDEVEQIKIKTPWEGLVKFYKKGKHYNFNAAENIYSYFENEPDDPAYSFEKAELLLITHTGDSRTSVIPTLREAKRLYQNVSADKKALADMRIKYLDMVLDAYDKYSDNEFENFYTPYWTYYGGWGADFSYQGVHYRDGNTALKNTPLYGWIKTSRGVQFGEFTDYYKRHYNGPGDRLAIWFGEDGWGWTVIE